MSSAPRIPLPTQDIDVVRPPDTVRIVLYNTSHESLYFMSGTIKVEIDDHSVPSLGLNRYVQLFLEPGRHRLHLEHWDLLVFDNEYSINFMGSDVFMEVYCAPTSTRFRRVDSLPPNFTAHYLPAVKNPYQWATDDS